MAPLLINSSMRYLSARVCPMSGSTVLCRTAASIGHNVLVSEYCLPQTGQLFIWPISVRFQSKRNREILASKVDAKKKLVSYFVFAHLCALASLLEITS